MANVLIVEDEAVLARSIARSLSNLGHVVTVASSLEEGERAFNEQHPEVALLDMELPDGDGLDLVARWTRRDSKLRILVMTAHTDPEYSGRAMELGARACVHKPMDLDHLADIVKTVLSGDEPVSVAASGIRK
jgi:DNA-binding response OmpR family regulator